MAETGLPNTNYRLHPIKDYYEVPYPDRPMRVCVVSDRQQLDHGIKALDIAKRLIDYRYHPPIFSPLIVKGALRAAPADHCGEANL